MKSIFLIVSLITTIALAETPAEKKHALREKLKKAVAAGTDEILIREVTREFMKEYSYLFEEHKKAVEDAALASKLQESFFQGKAKVASLEPLQKTSEGYIPSAGPATSTSSRADLISLDCGFDHVMLTLNSASGPFTISNKNENPIRPESFKKEIPGTTPCRVMVNASLFAEIGENGSQVLPVLQGTSELYLPFSVCLADGKGVCRAAPRAIRLDNTEHIFSTLRLLPNWKKEIGKAQIVIQYKRVKMDFARPSFSGIHPGDNPRLQNFINEELKKSLESKTDNSMWDFINRIGMADCDMLALGAARELVKDGGEGKIFIASGNRPLTDRILDIKNSNHAWNAILGNKEGGVFDNTPNVDQAFEVFTKEENIEWFRDQRLKLGKPLIALMSDDHNQHEKIMEGLKNREDKNPTIERLDLKQQTLKKSPFGDYSHPSNIVDVKYITRRPHNPYDTDSPIKLGTEVGSFSGSTSGFIVGPSQSVHRNAVDLKWLKASKSEGFQMKMSDLLKCESDKLKVPLESYSKNQNKNGYIEDLSCSLYSAKGGLIAAKRLNPTGNIVAWEQDGNLILKSEMRDITIDVTKQYDRGFHIYTQTYSIPAFVEKCRQKGVEVTPVTIISGTVVVD